MQDSQIHSNFVLDVYNNISTSLKHVQPYLLLKGSFVDGDEHYPYFTDHYSYC